ncbi:splicing factor, CC1-like protein [Violaceomyces palustris]|uniref:Splicing factor, CC1-like protein n=1 Tax=Violaceomyces palustris TaxID=1673888 RepID=A0ACD0NYN8_9BASI|nr:splicing factor, CC1-like protein [Violaceomyces palustris]
MYADREEAALSSRNYSSSSSARSPEPGSKPLIEKRSNGNRERSVRAPPESSPTDRERELQEQLRRRALATKSSAVRGRTVSRSPPSRSPTRSRSSSRSRSRESHRSRKSKSSIKYSEREPDDKESRRRRRREGRDEKEDGSARRRDRDHDLDEDEGEKDRYRRKRRSENAAYGDEEERDRDMDRDRDRGYRGAPRGDYYSRGDRYDRGDRYSRRSYDRDTYVPSRYDRDNYRRGGRDIYPEDDRRNRRRSALRSSSPARSHRSHRSPSPIPSEVEEYEERSVFCSQLAARLGQRDLGEFFEEHLGEGAVKDVRIVMDKLTRRSKGIGYVEFADRELVPKAMALSGKILFGIPILVQKTDAARNRGETNPTDAPYRPNLPQANQLPIIDPTALPSLPLPSIAGAPIHLNLGLIGGAKEKPNNPHPNTDARLYVGSLHFSLTDENVKAVFEPFGEIEYVDLHREPGTGKSKGYAFVQFKEPEDAKKALEQMNGFELAGRAIRVGNVNAKGSKDPTSQSATGANAGVLGGGQLPTATSSYDEGGGGGLNPDKRAALMEKLARKDASPTLPSRPAEPERPASIPQATSKSLLLKNMFNPEEETERDWDLELAEDVKDECQAKYGPVTAIHVEKESAGEIYLTFADLDSSIKAMAGLNGRWFGGKPISAHYIPEAFVNAKLLG